MESNETTFEEKKRKMLQTDEVTDEFCRKFDNAIIRSVSAPKPAEITPLKSNIVTLPSTAAGVFWSR